MGSHPLAIMAEEEECERRRGRGFNGAPEGIGIKAVWGKGRTAGQGLTVV